jgi:Rrf2 family iron-sulfur cluster assembly transcriptional regulator
MKLQAKTRYGVRAMFDLAFHSAGQAAQAKDIARREEIPLRYLEQIFQDLKRAGIVDARRGPRGGYSLRRPAEQIRLGEIVRALQGSLDGIFEGEDEAANGGEPRRRRASSGKHVTAALWRDLAAHVTQWFDGVSLGDLVKKGVALGIPRGERNAPMYFI